MIKNFSTIFFFCLVTAQYDYTLEDINSSSDTYGQQIGTSFFQNFVNHRYQLREQDILNKLIAHCNENSITIATGVSAQIDQAYDLGLIAKAVEDSPSFPTPPE